MFCEAGDGYKFHCPSPQRLAEELPKCRERVVVWGLWGVTPSRLKDALVL